MDVKRLHLILYLMAGLIHFVSSNYTFGQMSACCTFHDVEKGIFEYGLRYRYNKKLLMEYNSTRGNWEGFTEASIIRARLFNIDPDDARLRKLEEMIFCVKSLSAIKQLSYLNASPSLKVTTVKQPSGTEPAVLLCSAYNFYPQQIQVTWFKNGEGLTSDVSSTEVFSSGDLLYQTHSYLEHRPEPGEEISCMVEHVSLSEPLVQVWVPHPPRSWSEKVKIAVGTFFLVLGLTVLVIGGIKHKKRSAAFCTVTHGCTLVPVQVEHEEERSD